MLANNQYCVIAIDPGAAATGWARFVVDRKAFSRPEHKVLRYLKFWNCGEIPGPETTMLSNLVNLITDPSIGVGTAEVVSEDFDLTQLIGGKNLLSPVRINSVLEWECWKRSIPFSLQRRHMRTNVTKERLAAFLRTKRKFRKDEFAAMQHGIVKLRRMKEESRSLPWKLSEGGILNAKWDCRCERGKRCDLLHPQ